MRISTNYLMLFFCLALASCTQETTAEQYFQNAIKHLESGKLNSGVIETRNAVKKDPNHGPARALLGELELRIGNVEGADKELRKAAELGVPQSEIAVPFAEALLRQSKFDELMSMDIQNLEDQQQASILANQALAAVALEKPVTAQSKIDEALQLDSSSSEVFLANAQIEANNGNLDKARISIVESIKFNEQNSASLEFLGDLDAANQDDTNAIDAYSKAIEFSDNKAISLLKRSRLYLKIKEYEKSDDDLNTLSKLGVELPWIPHTRGEILLQQGKIDEAQTEQEEALKLFPDFSPAVSALTVIHFIQGNFGLAEQYGKQLATIAPDQLQSQHLLAAIRIEDNRYALAEKELKIALAGSNPNLQAIKFLALAYLKQENYDEAANTLFNVPVLVNETDNQENLLLNSPRYEVANSILPPGTADSSDYEKSFLTDVEQEVLDVINLVRQENLDEAMTRANALTAKIPENPFPLNVMARIHLANKNIEEAKSALEKSFALDDSNSVALTLFTGISIEEGNLDSARSLLKTASQKSDDSSTSLFLLASLEVEAGDDGAKRDWMQQNVTRNPESFNAMIILAGDYAANREFEQVLTTLDAMDSDHKSKDQVLVLRGFANLGLERYEQAIESFDAAIKINPRNPQLLYFRSQAHAGLDDVDSMLKDLNRAVEIDSKHRDSLVSLTSFHIATGNMASADRNLTILKEIIPDTSVLTELVNMFNERENSSTSDNDQISKIATADEALETASKLWNEGETGPAIEILEIWNKKEPENTSLLFALATVYNISGRSADAITKYRYLIEIAPDNVTALNNLAWLSKTSEPELAVVYAEKALQVDPNNVAILDTLAVIHLDNKNPEKAKLAFDKISEIGTTDNTILFHGAQIELALGNREAAKDILETITKPGANFADLQEAKNILRTIK